MSEQNPYAPPANDGLAVAVKKKARKKKAPREELEVWRELDCVVMAKEGARLPKRCVVCNQRIDGDRVTRQFQWHPPWVWATIACGWLPYLLISLATRKGARVELGMCAQHHLQRRNGLTIAWGGVGAGFLLVLLGATSKVSLLLGLGVLVLIALPIWGGRMARVAYPAKIDDQHLWLKVGGPFLESIPERDD